MRILTDSELHWLAAAIDDEGTICVKGGRPQLMIANTNRAFAERCADLMGCKIYKCQSPSCKQGFVYQIKPTSRMTVLKVLKQVEPLLMVKRKKAITAIRMILDDYDIADISLRAFPSLP